jgi:hypothetical protein
MSARDAKRKATDAARSLLNDRITAVEKLSLALHNYHQAQAAVTQAQTRADELAEHPHRLPGSPHRGMDHSRTTPGRAHRPHTTPNQKHTTPTSAYPRSHPHARDNS